MTHIDRHIFATVGELVEYLKGFPQDKPIIMDCDGDTGPVIVDVWDDNHDKDDVESPLAVFIL
jgi:hypothetical protein